VESAQAKTVLFLTGTRADFGKLKPLVLALVNSSEAQTWFFATGMHLRPEFGRTIHEVRSLGVPTHEFINFVPGDSTASVLAKTVSGLNDFLRTNPADYIVVHGDRPEALAGSVVGALNNIRVIHVEGGELSGTVDESLRHAVSKLSHIHLVSNATAAKRLRNLGEDPSSVFEIGSPEIDIMTSPDLPTFEEVSQRYEIEFDAFSVFIMHPVTTEDSAQLANASRLLLEQCLFELGENVVAIMPNNDFGSEQIMNVLNDLSHHQRLKVIPSMRFEYYLSLLRKAKCIIGNSSSGVREAPVFGIPSLNVGTRQNGRANSKSIFNIGQSDTEGMKSELRRVLQVGGFPPEIQFGTGNSARLFLEHFIAGDFDRVSIQKTFFED
jgi:UDP-N-acetylglucosamine 2-epimerase (hydrolysing)